MKKSEIGKDLLKYLALGGFLTLAMLSPIGGPKVVKSLFKYLKYRISQIRASAYYLKKRGLIEFIKEDDNNMVMKITDNGKKYLKAFDIDNMALSRPEVWDKKWRLVIFDVPEGQKRARNALRQKLKDLGLAKLQKSVWITPFPCNDEIRFLREIFDISFNVDVIIAEDIGYHEIKLKRLFKLV